jgi:dihydroorotate dehydrogenase/Pyruvate/2-oxoacid:ferredoxin oxidoreductase delta subunit
MADSIDISTSIGGMTLANPFIVGSGPTVRTVTQIKAAEDAGWAAASLKLTMDPAPYVSLPPRYRWLRAQKMHTFTAEKRLNLAEGLKLTADARAATTAIKIIANISHEGNEAASWAALARRFEQAGAHALELNMCCPNMSYNTSATGQATGKATGASLGADVPTLSAIVSAVCAAVAVPVIVKLTPEGGRVAEAAAAAMTAGAAAVGSAANRLGLPDIDIHNPLGPFYRLQDGITLGCLSGPWIRPFALRDTYEIRRRVGPGARVIGSGGVSDLSSAVQQIMTGADALWICTETMIRGFAWMTRLLEELRSYMKEMGWTKLKEFRDMILPTVHSAGELVIHPGHAAVDKTLCTDCGTCWDIGHCLAITHPDGGMRIDAARCTGCSTCVDLCPRKAIGMAVG